MAFVSISQRKITEVGEISSFPSPAHYHLQHKNASHDYAPFNSTSVRRTSFEANEDKVSPGPGAYNLNNPFVKPSLSSYVCLNNIIFKVNSQGSSSFQSQSKRFQYSIESTPGPSQYQTSNSAMPIKNSKKRLAKRKQLTTTTTNIVPSIPSKARGLISLLQKEKSRQQQLLPGPGSYQSKLKGGVNSKGTVWGKDKIKRFTIDVETNVGPGKYQPQALVDRHSEQLQGSIFRSNSVRTFFDSIAYNTNNENVAKIRQLKKYKNPSPSPGDYKLEASFEKTLSKPPEYQFFGSSVPRFTHQAQKLSPEQDFYQVKDSLKSPISHNKKQLPFNSKTQRDHSFLSVKKQMESLGPGYYIGISEVKRKKSGKVVEGFGSTTQRLVDDHLAAEVGPGKYDVSPLPDQSLKSLKQRFGQLNKETGVFKSQTQRQCFSNNRDSTAIAAYDLGYHDIATKLEKQAYYLQTLRRINVIKPPFESNSSRFDHYEQSVEQNPEAKSPPFRKERHIQMPKILPGASFGKGKRFLQKRKGGGSPGAGTYAIQEKWNKQTFNRRFQYQ